MANLKDSYFLFLHYKQGDDFASCLKNANDDTSGAFDLWAQHFKDCMEICQDLSSKLKSIDVKATGDTNSIYLFPQDQKAADVLDSIDILSKEEEEDE